jgi:hypothetical protein
MELPVAEQATDYADSEPIKQHLRFRIPRNPCNPWLAFSCLAKPLVGARDNFLCFRIRSDVRWLNSARDKVLQFPPCPAFG